MRKFQIFQRVLSGTRLVRRVWRPSLLAGLFSWPALQTECLQQGGVQQSDLHPGHRRLCLQAFSVRSAVGYGVCVSPCLHKFIGVKLAKQLSSAYPHTQRVLLSRCMYVSLSLARSHCHVVGGLADVCSGLYTVLAWRMDNFVCCCALVASKCVEEKYFQRYFFIYLLTNHF